HQRYLAGEEVSEPESPAPKAAKPTKPKSTKQAKPIDPKAATKKPKPASAKPKEKKRKPLVDQFIDEGVPAAKPRLEDTEEQILQKVLEESLTNSKGSTSSCGFQGNRHWETPTTTRGARKGERESSVLAGPNLEHSDVEITDASSQPQPEHMDEGFTATAYPNVQENLKLTTNEQVIPEEP
ncbi:hypothetical protein Tco_0125202, partial [Tanacetum coccineum]